MDDPDRISRLGEASCRSLRGFFDVCAESDMDPQQLVRDVPYSFEHLSDPARFIDWQSYSNFISNFRGLVSADELTEFARIICYFWPLTIWYYVRSITEVYDQQFGPREPAVAYVPVPHRGCRHGQRHPCRDPHNAARS